MRIFWILFVCVLFVSCKKYEGYGGLATIKGRVYAKNYNSNGTLVSEGYYGEVRVYISKHGETEYFDDLRSSYDGTFTFQNLHVGTYDLWVFGDCDNCSWNQMYELKTVTITEKKEEINLEDFVIKI